MTIRSACILQQNRLLDFSCNSNLTFMPERRVPFINCPVKVHVEDTMENSNGSFVGLGRKHRLSKPSSPGVTSNAEDWYGTRSAVTLSREKEQSRRTEKMQATTSFENYYNINCLSNIGMENQQVIWEELSLGGLTLKTKEGQSLLPDISSQGNLTTANSNQSQFLESSSRSNSPPRRLPEKHYITMPRSNSVHRISSSLGSSLVSSRESSANSSPFLSPMVGSPVGSPKASPRSVGLSRPSQGKQFCESSELPLLFAGSQPLLYSLSSSFSSKQLSRNIKNTRRKLDNRPDTPSPPGLCKSFKLFPPLRRTCSENSILSTSESSISFPSYKKSSSFSFSNSSSEHTSPKGPRKAFCTRLNIQRDEQSFERSSTVTQSLSCSPPMRGSNVLPPEHVGLNMSDFKLKLDNLPDTPPSCFGIRVPSGSSSSERTSPKEPRGAFGTRLSSMQRDEQSFESSST